LDKSQETDLLKLIFELGSDVATTRSSAAKLLGDLKDKRATKPLIEALKDENKEVQYNAVIVL